MVKDRLGVSIYQERQRLIDKANLCQIKANNLRQSNPRQAMALENRAITYINKANTYIAYRLLNK